MTKHAWVALLSLLLAACGGSSDGTGDGTGDDTSGDEDFDSDTDGEAGDTVHASAIELIGINPPEVPWSEMSHDDREMDMVSRFHPIFREIFSTHDAEEYGEFGCGDCHGEDMSDRNFEMPNPHLPPVPAAGSAEYTAERAEHAADYAFMEEHVLPPMQTMLGMGETFTCNGCHPAP
ncbi:MAG: hypothetical protein H6719_33175 [Sandaracinaceae bacterium]|nr:hypothetical protein [Sandaracinaceae bacterium]